MDKDDKDLEHLKLLSIFYYISAGITAFFSCFPLIYVAMGVAIVLGALDGDKNPPPAFLGWILISFGSLVVLAGWTLAFCSFLTARYLKQHKNYIFCNIIAGINCAFFPTGIILGVFTFLVLLREPVRQLFNGVAPGEFQLPATAALTPLTPPDWR